MVLGLSLAAFTKLHVAISLIAIGSGLLVALGLLTKRRLPVLTAVFLLTTILTSVTGFLFPIHGVTPGIVLGILSLVVLLIAVVAHYSRHESGGWRTGYIVTAMIALYFNCFVLIAQSFQKIAGLHALAPSAFKLAQLSLLLVFVALTLLIIRKSRPAPVPDPQPAL
jgi:hypothetical protein